MSFLREVQLNDKFGPFVAFQTGLGFVPNLVQAQTSLPRLIEAQALLESAIRFREGAISESRRNEYFSVLLPNGKTRIACPWIAGSCLRSAYRMCTSMLS